MTTSLLEMEIGILLAILRRADETAFAHNDRLEQLFFNKDERDGMKNVLINVSNLFMTVFEKGFKACTSEGLGAGSNLASGTS